MSSPTGRSPDFKGLPVEEIRILPRNPRSSIHFVNANYVNLEAHAMAAACDKCPACGEMVMKMFLIQHCKEKGDGVHLVLEVLRS